MPTPTAIITGAGSGIGRATALRLAGMGFAIALVGRTTETLKTVAAEIAPRGPAPLIIPANVSKPEQVESMVQRTFKHFGRIDVLINNAGMAPAVSLADLTPKLWQEILDTNLSSAFYATRAVWPIMKAQHASPTPTTPPIPDAMGGVIINISSMAAKDPFPGLGAYAVAKIGLNMLSQVTAREGDSVGIRAIAIAPAAVETPMLRKFVGDQPIDPNQILHPDDIAAAITDFITGPLRHSSGETLYLHRRPA